MEIWVNPACSKCQAATAALDEAGVDYTVRRYLDEPPTVEELAAVVPAPAVDADAVDEVAEDQVGPDADDADDESGRRRRRRGRRGRGRGKGGEDETGEVDDEAADDETVAATDDDAAAEDADDTAADESVFDDTVPDTTVPANAVPDSYTPDSGADDFTVASYDLELSYRVATNRLDGRATISAVATAPLRRAVFDLVGLRVSRVRVDGHKARFSQSATKLTVTRAK